MLHITGILHEEVSHLHCESGVEIPSLFPHINPSAHLANLQGGTFLGPVIYHDCNSQQEDPSVSEILVDFGA